MSESTPENESGTRSETESHPTTQDTPDQGLISDEQLPDDLRPDLNPLAKPPGDSDGDQAAGGPAGPGGAQDTGGAPDAGQPG